MCKLCLVLTKTNQLHVKIYELIYELNIYWTIILFSDVMMTWSYF